MTAVLYVASETAVARHVQDERDGWSSTGTAELPSRVMAIAVAERPSSTVLYAVSTADEGTLTTVRIEDGVPVVVGSVATGGPVPCSIAVSSSGAFVAIANYRSGTVGVHGLDSTGAAGAVGALASYDGSGPDARRQDGSHPHCVLAVGDSDLLVADLGADALRLHHWDAATGALSPAAEASTAQGAGPRHAIVVNDSWIVVADELGATVSVFRLDAQTRAMELVERLALPLGASADDVRDYPGDVVAVGRFLYAATRGANVITQLELREGRLVAVDEVPSGAWPLKLATVGGSLLCAARDDDMVVQWSLDSATGRLRDRRPAVEIARPVWVASTTDREVQ